MGANAQTKVPTFAAAEVLTAANQNLLSNGIPVFSGTATRNDAFGGSGEKTLAEGQFAYLEDSNTTQYYDGAAWQSVAVTPTQAVFREEQAAGTYGGGSTSGSYQKRTLNTTVVNNITGCSIASSVITLPAGTYYVTAVAPVYSPGSVRCRLQNTTDSTTIGNGTNHSINSVNNSAVANIEYYFTLAAQKDIELQTRVANSVATDGLGTRCNFGDTEVYSSISITKVA
jgi:hypothetical protein